MELKCEHLGKNVTFLELEIIFRDDIFVYKLYDKRDAFPLSIVRMPNLSSNIPSNTFYGAVFSELLRIVRATLLFDDFMPRACQLYHRMFLQGETKAKLNLQMRKTIRQHPEAFEKYNTTPEDVVSKKTNHGG